MRLRVRAVLWSVAIGGTTASVANLFGILAGMSLTPRLNVAVVGGWAVAFVMTRSTGAATPVMAAALIEAHGSQDNLIVTAVELAVRPRPGRAEIQDEILTQAKARLALVEPASVVPLRHPIAVTAAIMAGAFAVLSLPSDALAPPQAVEATLQASTRGIDGFTVEIVPPAYSGRPSETVTSPVQVTMVAGSRVRLVVASDAEGVVAELVGQPPLTLARDRDGFVGEWLAERSNAVAIRPVGGAGRDAKFLSVIVVPDAPPVVRVPAPGTDLAITGTKGRITVEVDGQDDLGLASLSVRFTKASGGGEALTFTEGELPLVMTRVTDRHWRGRAEWVLDGLALADGDVLVYRAIARDRNPNGSPVQSEAYLVEVGRLAGAVGAGFALPAEEKKYAISQQMVIYKTEQLIAAFKSKGVASRGPGEGWLEQNQLLGIEQRMVRAEVVFLGGGEVQDEVEEAAHSHEVAEGRLENVGRAEMLRVINFMSRAEAELNAGRAAEALVLEREALTALERAFDRRRYFLRTLPERSRIDPTRRLTGALKDVRPWTRDRASLDGPPGIALQRALMRDLAAAATAAIGADAALAARIAALDPADASLQQAAVTLATATSEQSGQAAVWGAMQAVTSHALKSLGSAAAVRLAIDPLAGRLADELVPPGKGRR